MGFLHAIANGKDNGWLSDSRDSSLSSDIHPVSFLSMILQFRACSSMDISRPNCFFNVFKLHSISSWATPGPASHGCQMSEDLI